MAFFTFFHPGGPRPAGDFGAESSVVPLSTSSVRGPPTASSPTARSAAACSAAALGSGAPRRRRTPRAFFTFFHPGGPRPAERFGVEASVVPLATSSVRGSPIACSATARSAVACSAVTCSAVAYVFC